MRDQAESLRNIVKRSKKRLFTFASGKIGLGYSTILANLAIALAENTDKKLLIVESRESHQKDNVHIISNIIRKEYENLSVIVDKEVLDIDRICEKFDYFIIDIGPVYNSVSIDKILLMPDLVTIVTPTNNAKTHCYAMLKSIIKAKEKAGLGKEENNDSDNECEIRLITNLVKDDEQAEQVNNGIILTVKEFLDTDIDVLGNIPVDINVIESTREYMPFISSYPESPASLAIYRIAKRLKLAENNITISKVKDILTRIFTLS